MNAAETIKKYTSSLQTVADSDNRQIVFAYLVGSQNYGLDGKDSDVDVKVFMFPNLRLLYKGGVRGGSATVMKCKDGEAEIHDFRDISDLIGKMNPTYLEMFFTEFCSYPDETFRMTMDGIRKIIPDLFREERRVFIDATMGTYMQRLRNARYKDAGSESEKTKINKSLAICARMLCLNKFVVVDGDYQNNGFDPAEAFGMAMRMTDAKCAKFKEAAMAFKFEGDLMKGLRLCDEACGGILPEGYHDSYVSSAPSATEFEYVVDAMSKLGSDYFYIGKNMDFVPDPDGTENRTVAPAKERIDNTLYDYFCAKVSADSNALWDY